MGLRTMSLFSLLQTLGVLSMTGYSGLLNDFPSKAARILTVGSYGAVKALLHDEGIAFSAYIMYDIHAVQLNFWFFMAFYLWTLGLIFSVLRYRGKGLSLGNALFYTAEDWVILWTCGVAYFVIQGYKTVDSEHQRKRIEKLEKENTEFKQLLIRYRNQP